MLRDADAEGSDAQGEYARCGWRTADRTETIIQGEVSLYAAVMRSGS
jgi:hypothetical protein